MAKGRRVKSSHAGGRNETAAKSDFLIPLSLTALAILLLLPVFLYSFPNGDDAAQHYWWSKEFINEIGQGTIYPRWLSGAYEGRGSPVMLYYPPLPFYVVAFFYAFVGEPLRALALAYWLGLALSGLTIYLFSRSLLPQRESLAAAGFYMAAHYHLFDLYQRAAQHEFWAFVWVPLLLYGIYRVSTEDNSRALPYITLGYFLLLVTHLPTTLMVTYLLPLYALLLSRDWRRIVRVVAGLAVGAGMAAIYLFSYLFERDHLKSLGERTEIQRYYSGFLLENLSSAFAQVPLPSSGNFKLFVLAGDWMAVGFLVLLAVCSWVIWNSEYRRSNLVLSLWAVTVFSLLLSTRISMPLWMIVPKFKQLQFPIRWFTITSLGVSLLFATAVSAIARCGRLCFKGYALAAAVVLNLALSGLVMTRAPFQPEALQKRILHYTDVREYHPKWWDQKRHAEFDAAPVVVDKGNAEIRVIDDRGASRSYIINAEQESLLRFRTLYFPGWTARAGGQPVMISPGKEGHIQMEVGPGEHILMLSFEDTTPRTAGKTISALSLVAFCVILYISRRRPGSLAVKKTKQ